MGEYLPMTALPEQRNTGANLQEFCRAGLANGSNSMGFPLTGRWQSVLAQAWWRSSKQGVSDKLSVFLDCHSSSKCLRAGPSSFSYLQ